MFIEFLLEGEDVRQCEVGSDDIGGMSRWDELLSFLIVGSLSSLICLAVILFVFKMGDFHLFSNL